MRETVLRLNSTYLENERSIWIREPDSVSGASGLVVFPVSGPIDNMAFAVGQLAVFQGGASRTGTSDEHI
jgi:hypothetical protein